jgi:hypothetical protein
MVEAARLGKQLRVRAQWLRNIGNHDADTRLQPVAGNVAAGQISKTMILLNQYDLDAGDTVRCSKADHADPGTGVEHPIAGAGTQ